MQNNSLRYRWENSWGDNFEKARQIIHVNYAFPNIKNGRVVLGNVNQLGGIMFWQYSGDNSTLLKTIYNNLRYNKLVDRQTN